MTSGTKVSAVPEGVAEEHAGLKRAIRDGLKAFWEQQIVGDLRVPLMRQESSPLRRANSRARRAGALQVEGYGRIVAAWRQDAANNAG